MNSTDTNTEFLDRLAAAMAERASAAAWSADIKHALIPPGYKLESLEKAMDAPARFRGRFSTEEPAAFVDYLATHVDELSAVFVDQFDMRAKAIIDHGSAVAPLWRDHIADLKLEETPELQALRQLALIPRSQRDLLDFIADWHPQLTFSSSEYADPGDMSATTAAARLQKIEASIKTDATSEETQTAQSRSLAERRAVSGKPPVVMLLSTEAYVGLSMRTVAARMAYVVNAKGETEIRIRILATERLKRACAEELIRIVESGMPRKTETDPPIAPVRVGTFI